MLFTGPFIPVVGTELPGREIILRIAEKIVPFLGGIAVFHDQRAAHLHDDLQRADADGTFLHAGIAGSAGP